MKLNKPIGRSLGPALVFFELSVLFCLTTTHAQQATTPAQRQTTGTGAINLTASSANVGESGVPVRINILRWSTDEERNLLAVAMNPPPPAPTPAAAPAGGRGAQGARGGAGRGGRGDAAPKGPVDPIVALTAAIGKAPTVGYIWTNEVVGYSIKYAYRASLPDGGERIILATDRRLGAYTTAWKPVASAIPTDYDFSVIEMRLDSKGLGEGKTTLTTKVILENEAKTIALENYAATPAILKNVKR